MKIYLIRHGETISNLKGTYNIVDDDLTDYGIIQAKDLGDKLNNLNYDIVISSTMQRAKHTTSICNIKNKTVIFDDRIVERNLGDLCGKPLNVIDRNDYWNYYSDNIYCNAESVKMLFNRVFDFINDLKLKKYNNVLIVAHNGVAKAFSAYFDGIKDGNFLNRGIKNCEIKEYNL